MANTWKTKVRLWDSKKGGYVVANLSLDIDWDAIARRMGNQAFKSKHHKSTFAAGAVKAKITSIEEA